MKLALFAVLSAGLIGSTAAERLQPRQMLRPVAGTLTLSSGVKIDLAHLRGSVVLINYWASWCPPCAAELPVLDRAYRMHRSKGLRIFAVAADAGEHKRLVRAEWPYAMPLAKSVSSQTLSFRQGLPVSYLIDRSGRVRQVKNGAFSEAGLDAALREVFAHDR